MATSTQAGGLRHLRVAPIDPEARSTRVGFGSSGLEAIVGQSRAIERVREQIAEYAPTVEPVLIHGETGTGKELVAAALHGASARASGPLVALNCAAIPEALFESELFGCARGAFTGADRERHGLLHTARGGTLFLDEVGELAPAAQAKLLRMLDGGTYRPLGATGELYADVRVIAATNRDLWASQQASFRADLYYRLAVLEIHVPPLRERVEDIPHLVGGFLLRHRPERPLAVAPEAWEALLAAPWRGNVRELENVVFRTIVSTPGDVIHRFALKPEPASAGELGRAELVALLTRHRGCVGAVAAALCVSTRTVQRHMVRHRLSRRAFSRLVSVSPATIPPDRERPGEWDAI